MWFRVLTPTLISQLGRLLSEAGYGLYVSWLKEHIIPVLTPRKTNFYGGGLFVTISQCQYK
nr:MAG TPA: ABBA-PTs-type aromatic prenyltransferase [Bacteriophage sp.]